MKHLLILLSLISLTACKEPQARKPISRSNNSTRDYSIDTKRTKENLKLENKAITDYIKKDSTAKYINSNNGFMYTYINKNATATQTPKHGDALLYTYYVTDIGNNVIYNTTEIGAKVYYIDQESNVIEGLRQGLKLIKTGEEIKFIFPSQLAYGYRGDGRKIKPNFPIICYVTLKELTTKQSSFKKIN